jgi:arylsulfatase A-like enzyme
MRTRVIRAGALALGLLAALLAAATVLRAPGAARPLLRERAGGRPFRVVVVVIDALRADRLSFYGHARNTAPFLGRLAAAGAVFERAYAASSWTSSAMASLFTGLYPDQHHVLTGYNFTRRSQRGDRPLRLNRIPDTAPTLPEVVRRLGLPTYAVAANPNIGEPMGFSRGFDRFARTQQWSAEAVNAQVLGWREDLAAADAYFLYLHYMDTHMPYPRREPWYDASQPSEPLARYDSAIGYLDARLEELYRALGWHERTLLLVLADHGEEFGDHGGHGHRNQLYAELLRIPLLLHWPGVVEPRRVSDPVSQVDLLPTLESLLGADAPRTGTDGVDLSSLLDGGTLPERTLFAVRATEMRDPPLVRRAALRGRWKYVRSWPGGTEELYDAEADPRDERDLLRERRAVAAALRRELEAFEARPKRHPRAYRDSERPAAELEEELRALGYVE